MLLTVRVASTSATASSQRISTVNKSSKAVVVNSSRVMRLFESGSLSWAAISISRLTAGSMETSVNPRFAAKLVPAVVLKGNSTRGGVPS